MDPSKQNKVVEIRKDSPAAIAGLAKGDRLLSVGRQKRVLTIGDVSWALEKTPREGGGVPITWQRDGASHSGTLKLEAGWRVGTPLEFAWRPQKWRLSPAPGFGGPLLTAEEKASAGLKESDWAFRIQYVVNWGRSRHRGKPVHDAGLRRGDIVVSYAKKSDFESMDHWHAWVRLTKSVGDEVEVVYLRKGKRHTTSYRLVK